MLFEDSIGALNGVPVGTNGPSSHRASCTCAWKLGSSMP
jgi:hypothetical protein